MGRLRLYADARGATAMHESGFSWLAAFSLPAWALQRRLYGVAAASLLYGLGLGLVAHLWQLDANVQATLYGLNFLASGFLAARLQRWMLSRRGFIVTAEEPMPVAKGKP